jgi:uncharacterized protein YlzI (FlbEa/FlbD family)
MLRLTNPDGDELMINPDYIKMVSIEPIVGRAGVDRAPMAVTEITLRDGSRHLVRESAAEIERRFIGFMRQIHACIRPILEPADSPAAEPVPAPADVADGGQEE